MKLSRLPRGLSALIALLFLSGCAQTGRLYPLGERGRMTSTNSLKVKTTAYTGKRNAIGQRLSLSGVISAASDWSEFPLGTRFRVRETGKLYVIDDYGSALIGTRTIDLCQASNREMHAWGVRYVNIEILEWGSPRQSVEVLSARGNRMARRMMAALRKQTKGIPEQFHRKKLQ